MVSHEQKIADAAATAMKVVADAAAKASEVVAQTAAEAIKTQKAEGANDHDVIVSLIRSFADFKENVNEKFAEIKTDIKDLKDGTTSRIACLETEKLNIMDHLNYKEDVDRTLKDHEIRIRKDTDKITRLTSYGIAGMFVIGVIEFLLSIYFRIR